MALKPATIQFLINRVTEAQQNSLIGATAQIFEHLRDEVKDNPVYDKYEGDLTKWSQWYHQINEVGNDWELPRSFAEAKSLSYAIYENLAKAEDSFDFLYNIFHEGKFNELKYSLNSSFANYFAQALDDIIRANPELESEPEKAIGTKVFIIHGHEELIKRELQLFLQRAGVPNIVLHEQPDRGRS